MNIPHLKWKQIENHEVSTAVHENVILVYTHIEKVAYIILLNLNSKLVTKTYIM